MKLDVISGALSALRPSSKRLARELDRRIDALLTGSPSPNADSITLPSEQQANVESLTNTMSQAISISNSGAAHQGSGHVKNRIWNDMMVQTAQSRSPKSVANPSPRTNDHTGERFSRHRALGRTSAAINAAFVVALVLAVGFGAWWTIDGNRTGGSDDPSQLTALELATPTSGQPPEQITLPTAEDCTVEPLTIEQVLAIYEDPYNEEMYAQTVDYTGSGAENFPDAYDGPPSTETLEQVTAVQREWNACAIAGSWMQLFALLDGYRLQEVLDRYIFPTYFTREDAVAILETLRETGEGLDGLGARQYFGGSLEFVNPDPAYSRHGFKGSIQSAMFIYDSDGRLRRVEELTEPSPWSDDFVWDPASGTWKMLGGMGVLG